MSRGTSRATPATRSYGETWLKTADRVGLAKLVKKSSLTAFRVWKAATERWARTAGGEMTQLTALEVADAAPRLLAADLYAELVTAEKVEATWDQLLVTLQWKLGLNPDALI